MVRTPTVHPAGARALSETDFQAQIVQLAKQFGWRTYHPWLSIHSARGWPDLAICRPGRLILAELKAEGKDPTPAQAEWLALLGTVAGIEVYLWRPSDWDTIQAVLTGQPPRGT